MVAQKSAKTGQYHGSCNLFFTVPALRFVLKAFSYQRTKPVESHL
jgi:hypothetical protein